jgi:hypothetical protein
LISILEGRWKVTTETGGNKGGDNLQFGFSQFISFREEDL